MPIQETSVIAICPRCGFRRRDRCSVSGCTETATKRGFCDCHYARWRRYGDPEAGQPPRRKDWLLARPATTSGEKFTTIQVGRGLHAIVDIEDYAWLSARKWKVAGGYAARTSSRRTYYMHRLVLAAGPGQHVDHINGNVFDNRRVNLRFATQQQNIHNAAGRRRGTSKYKGVSIFGRLGLWQAQIVANGHKRHLGYFRDEKAAARAYNAAAREAFGEYAHVNQGVE